MSGQGLPQLQGAGDGIMGQHIQLHSDHESTQAQWMHLWTNIGSGECGNLDVFLFKLGDNKIRISSIFPEGQDARQYMMQKMERGFYLIPFDQSNVIEVINLDTLDAVTTPEGLILEEVSNGTPCTEKKIVKTVKRKRTSTDWREETRPQIAARRKELLETEKLISELESKFSCQFSFLMGNLSTSLDREQIQDLIAKGKDELTSVKNDLISFVAQEKVKKEKTTKRKKEKKTTTVGEEEQEVIADLGLALENALCSRAYLTKLQTFVECQKTWMTTLQSGIAALETGTTKAAQNQEVVLQLQTRQNVLANPAWNPGHYLKSDQCDQVL